MLMKYIFNKNIVQSFFVIFGFLFLSGLYTKVEATHIVGGEMTYKYLGGTSYQINLTLRRDCYLGSPEAEFDDPASIGVFTASGDLASWLPGLKFGQLLLPFMASDTLNEYIKSDCGFEGTQVCVHETTYQGVVSLPNRPGGYILAYQRCCRNGSINNIIEPLETGSTYWVTIGDKALTYENSSPTFKNWPDVYICNDKQLVFDHSAIDVDGDSLVYRLCTPNSGASRNLPKPQPPNFPPFPLVDFAPPYTIDNLMGGEPLVLDPQTGIMTATPNLVGQFLIGVCVEEYRNGELIGVIKRDFQFNVRVCSQPPLAQFTTSESNCDGLTVEFYNNSLASNDFIWNFDYPNQDPAFMSQEANPVFTFPKSGIYKVHLMATRGSDLCSDTIVQTVYVFENKITPDFTYLLNGCDSNMDSLEVLLIDNSDFNEPGYQLDTWQWKITQNGQEKFVSGNPANIKLSTDSDFTIEMVVTADNGCTSTLIKEVDIHELVPKIDFVTELVRCPTTDDIEISFTDISQSLNPLAILNKSEWHFGNQIINSNPLVVIVPRDSKTVTIKLVSTFRDACDVSLEKTIELDDLIPFADAAMQFEGCPDDGNVDITIKYLDTNAKNVDAISLDWLAGIRPDLKSYNGPDFRITIPKDSVLHYSLIATFANGCVDTIKVDTIPGPFATLEFNGVPIVLCPGETKSILLNGNADWTYIWSPMDGLDLSDPADPKVLSNGDNRTYYVTVTDGLCTVIDSIDIVVLDGGIDVFITGDSITCDDTIILTAHGGVGEGEYMWSDDPNVVNIIALGETVTLHLNNREKIFYVSFKGEACSTEPASFKVYNEKPLIDNLSPFKFCKEDTAKILILNQVPYHDNIYSWEDNPHIIRGHNTFEPTIGIGPNETGSFYLYYNVENQFGCQLRDSVLFNIGENPIVEFTYDLTECGLYQICFDAVGSFEGFLFWDFGDPNTSDDKSIEKSPCYQYPEAGSYTVLLSNKNPICPFKDIVKEVKVNPVLTIDHLEDAVTCFGDTIHLVATSNFDDVTYQWLDQDGNIVATNSQFTTIVKDDYQYIIKAVDANGCTATDTVNVRLFRFEFTVAVSTGDSLCTYEPSSIKLNVANAEAYDIEWYPADIIVSGQNTTEPVILLIDDRLIGVKLIHKETGCTDSVAVKLNIAQPFDFNVSVPELICYSEQTLIDLLIANPENYIFNWTPESAFSSGLGTAHPVLNIDRAQSIHVEVISKINGCKRSLEIPLDISNPLEIEVTAEPNAIINEGETVELNVISATSGISFVWSTGEGGPSIMVSPEETTTYYVTGTDKDGCSAMDTVTVIVRKAKCDETDVYLPNAFTPNGDNTNDVFIPRSNFIDEMELIIYNRWGQEVFRSKDKTRGWDGTFNDKPLGADSYAYYLKVICVNAFEYVKRGNVTLLR